jgi:hypothetical protein
MTPPQFFVNPMKFAKPACTDVFQCGKIFIIIHPDLTGFHKSDIY